MKIRHSNSFGRLSKSQLAAFERAHRLSLPADYRRFLLRHNGGEPHPNVVDFVEGGCATSSDVRVLYGVYDADLLTSLTHQLAVYRGRIVPEGLAIAEDSGGNQYVLIVAGERAGQVFFWDHEQETDSPGYSNLHFIGASFSAFLDALHATVDRDEPETDRIVRENDLPALRRLLDSGYDLETTDAYGRTLLENATVGNRVEMIQLLVDRGARLRNALELARQNYRFFEEFAACVELLERLQAQGERRPPDG